MLIAGLTVFYILGFIITAGGTYLLDSITSRDPSKLTALWVGLIWPTLPLVALVVVCADAFGTWRSK